MKKLMFCLACLALIACLTPALHATPAAPSDQEFLASLSPAPAVEAPAAPAKSSPADLFQPTPMAIGCTETFCIAQCSDCPPPHRTPYCISTIRCTCGCR